MASRYSNFPVSLYQDRSRDKCFSVWMWTAILRFNTSPWVCVCVSARRHQSLRGYRAVHLWQPQTLFFLSYPPIVVIWPASVQTLWNPEQASLGRGLTECFSDSHECFLKIGIFFCSVQALSPAQLVHASIISPCRLYTDRLAGGPGIHTVILHRRIKIQTHRF